MVECLTQDRGVTGLSLTSVTALCPRARHINPSLVLVQPRKTRPYITERLLMRRKESNPTNKKVYKGLRKFMKLWYLSKTILYTCQPSCLICLKVPGHKAHLVMNLAADPGVTSLPRPSPILSSRLIMK